MTHRAENILGLILARKRYASSGPRRYPTASRSHCIVIAFPLSLSLNSFKSRGGGQTLVSLVLVLVSPGTAMEPVLTKH